MLDPQPKILLLGKGMVETYGVEMVRLFSAVLGQVRLDHLFSAVLGHKWPSSHNLHI